MRRQVTKHVPWHHWTILDKESQERNGPDTKLLSRRKLKLCLSQNFYFGQMSSNIGEYKTIANMYQLAVWLGLHFAANSSWQAYEGPSLSGLGAPWELEGVSPLLWLGSRLVTPAPNSFSIKILSAVPCGWYPAVSVEHLSMFWCSQTAACSASLDLPAATSTAHLHPLMGWLPPGSAHRPGCLVFVKGCQPHHLLAWFLKRIYLALTSNRD